MGSLPMLQQFPTRVREKLCRCVRLGHFGAGDVVYFQGDEVDNLSSLYIVIEGSVSLFKNSDYDRLASPGDSYCKWTSGTGGYGDKVRKCGIGSIFGEV